MCFTLSPQPGEAQVASRLFGEMESMKETWNIAEYAVSQPSLEQIFLRFANDQRPEDGEGGGETAGNPP